MAKISQQDMENRISTNTNGRLQLVSEYKGRDYKVLLHCTIHNIDFETSGDAASRTPIRCNCPQCIKEAKNERLAANRVETECAYCHKKIIKQASKVNNSKSGLFFCCREHKDAAQRIDSGKEFDIMRPDHYGKENSVTNYRKRAFDVYSHQCAVCGWNEDEDILQVHHIDENRQNGDIENLILLCPTCHWKITTHKYKLIDRERIVLC